MPFIIYLMLLNCAHYLKFLANDSSRAHMVSWAHFLVKPQWRQNSCYILCTLSTLQICFGWLLTRWLIFPTCQFLMFLLLLLLFLRARDQLLLNRSFPVELIPIPIENTRLLTCKYFPSGSPLVLTCGPRSVKLGLYSKKSNPFQGWVNSSSHTSCWKI